MLNTCSIESKDNRSTSRTVSGAMRSLRGGGMMMVELERDKKTHKHQKIMATDPAEGGGRGMN